jgi:hypothetical protein
MGTAAGTSDLRRRATNSPAGNTGIGWAFLQRILFRILFLWGQDSVLVDVTTPRGFDVTARITRSVTRTCAATGWAAARIGRAIEGFARRAGRNLLAGWSAGFLSRFLALVMVLAPFAWPEDRRSPARPVT